MTTALTDAVQEALRADGRITSKHIHVASNGGNVELHGVVDSLDEFGIAQEIAERVPGVGSVSNHLQIDGEVNTGPCCPPM